MTDTVKYWIELSDYDLVTADAMLESGRYLYVGFMCHQAIEEILKAYYAKFHDLTLLTRTVYLTLPRNAAYSKN